MHLEQSRPDYQEAQMDTFWGEEQRSVSQLCCFGSVPGLDYSRCFGEDVRMAEKVGKMDKPGFDKDT